jgi:ketosteroid isomerase-like protein
MKSDEQAIREGHATWIDAVDAGDLVRLLTSMTDNVVFLIGAARRSVVIDSPSASLSRTNNLGFVA